MLIHTKQQAIISLTVKKYDAFSTNGCLQEADMFHPVDSGQGMNNRHPVWVEISGFMRKKKVR